MQKMTELLTRVDQTIRLKNSNGNVTLDIKTRQKRQQDKSVVEQILDLRYDHPLFETFEKIPRDFETIQKGLALCTEFVELFNSMTNENLDVSFFDKEALDHDCDLLKHNNLENEYKFLKPNIPLLREFKAMSREFDDMDAGQRLCNKFELLIENMERKQLKIPDKQSFEKDCAALNYIKNNMDKNDFVEPTFTFLKPTLKFHPLYRSYFLYKKGLHIQSVDNGLIYCERLYEIYKKMQDANVNLSLFDKQSLDHDNQLFELLKDKTDPASFGSIQLKFFENYDFTKYEQCFQIVKDMQEIENIIDTFIPVFNTYLTLEKKKQYKTEWNQYLDKKYNERNMSDMFIGNCTNIWNKHHDKLKQLQTNVQTLKILSEMDENLFVLFNQVKNNIKNKTKVDELYTKFTNDRTQFYPPSFSEILQPVTCKSTNLEILDDMPDVVKETIQSFNNALETIIRLKGSTETYNFKQNDFCATFSSFVENAKKELAFEWTLIQEIELFGKRLTHYTTLCECIDNLEKALDKYYYPRKTPKVHFDEHVKSVDKILFLKNVFSENKLNGIKSIKDEKFSIAPLKTSFSTQLENFKELISQFTTTQVEISFNQDNLVLLFNKFNALPLFTEICKKMYDILAQYTYKWETSCKSQWVTILMNPFRVHLRKPTLEVLNSRYKHCQYVLNIIKLFAFKSFDLVHTQIIFFNPSCTSSTIDGEGDKYLSQFSLLTSKKVTIESKEEGNIILDMFASLLSIFTKIKNEKQSSIEAPFTQEDIENDRTNLDSNSDLKFLFFKVKEEVIFQKTLIVDLKSGLAVASELLTIMTDDNPLKETHI